MSQKPALLNELTTLEFLRFLSKCRFDPGTGCVIWVGGTSSGHGKTARYGVFKFRGRRWFAHRWTAKYIFGLEIEDKHVDHICRTTLCVQHIQSVTADENRRLQWVRVEVGLEQYEEKDVDLWTEIPFYSPPGWMRAPSNLPPVMIK